MADGEIKGVRQRADDLARRIREGGGSAEYAERKSREAAQRLDQRVREGKAVRPQSDGR